MTNLMKSMKIITFAVFALLAANTMNAQCIAWTELPNGDEIENAHVLYKDAMDTYDVTEEGFTTANAGFQKAFGLWKTAYEGAPAANGDRSDHYSDGVDFYIQMVIFETDEAKKDEYKKNIYRLYDEHLKCYPKEEGTIMSYKATNMFYYLRAPYSDLLATLDRAHELKGDDVSYGVYAPYASVAVYNFQQGTMTAEKAREIYEKMNKVADVQLEKEGEFASYHDDARKNMNAAFGPIASDIFDCEFFKKKYEPFYRDSSDNFELIQRIYLALKDQGCEDTDPLMAELKGKYDVLVVSHNAKEQEEYFKRNPSAYAADLLKNGDYDGAIAKFKEAIDKEKAEGNDSEKLASHNYYLASIYNKKKSYSTARDYARKAAKLKPNWGKPFMLIGDMYYSSSSSCGKDEFTRGLAVIAAMNKYSYAKSIDASVAEEANRKINKYSKYKPSTESMFQRGKKKGQKAKVGCWIGETVTL